MTSRSNRHIDVVEVGSNSIRLRTFEPPPELPKCLNVRKGRQAFEDGVPSRCIPTGVRQEPPPVGCWPVPPAALLLFHAGSFQRPQRTSWHQLVYAESFRRGRNAAGSSKVRRPSIVSTTKGIAAVVAGRFCAESSFHGWGLKRP